MFTLYKFCNNTSKIYFHNKNQKKLLFIVLFDNSQVQSLDCKKVLKVYFVIVNWVSLKQTICNWLVVQVYFWGHLKKIFYGSKIHCMNHSVKYGDDSDGHHKIFFKIVEYYHQPHNF